MSSLAPPETPALPVSRARGFSPRGRTAALTITTLLSLACFSFAIPLEGNSRETPDAASRSTLTVLTWNIAHGRGTSPNQFGHPEAFYKSNLDAVARTLARESPDVVALQEADAPSAWSGSFDHVARIVEATGFPHVYHGLHFEAGVGPLAARYGTAILSRLPLRDTASSKLPDRSFHTKGFVRAEIEFEQRPLLLVSLHLNSDSKEVRRNQVDHLVEALSPLNKPMIVMGDFNSRWEAEDDAVRLVTEKLRLRAFEPDSATQHTFRSGHPTRRIDWILISPELDFVEYGTVADRASDHLAVRATVRWK